MAVEDLSVAETGNSAPYPAPQASPAARRDTRTAYSVLFVSTFAFTVCFAVWMMFGVIGIPLRQELGLNNTEFGLLTSTPVLFGAIMRLPLGVWTDRFGGRAVFTTLLLVASVPVFLVSYAHAFWAFLLIGAARIVGHPLRSAPDVARFFPKERRGFAMGFFGAGSIGAAVNMFVAPPLLTAWGWQAVPRVYAAALLVTAIIFWMFSAPDPGAGVKAQVTLAQRLAVLKDWRVWKLCQYYSLTFGGFAALSLWMTQYYAQEYGFDVTRAALLAAAFALPAGALRAVGGWLSDRFGAQKITWWVLWVAWIALFLLSYPQTELTVRTIDGARTFNIAVVPVAFTVLLLVLGIALAFGMSSTFKYVGDDFPESMGVVTGIVGLAGGLAGFLLPVLWGAMLDLLRVRSSCFMLLYGVVWVSLILIYFTEVRRYEFIERRGATP
jgi:NNP family nitrate/nitrite transporter-like MFS transporter